MKVDVEVSIKPAKDAFRTTQELLMWKWVSDCASQSEKSKDEIYDIFKVMYLWPQIKSKLPKVAAIESLIQTLPKSATKAVFAPHISHDKANKPELDEALTNFALAIGKKYKLSSACLLHQRKRQATVHAESRKIVKVFLYLKSEGMLYLSQLQETSFKLRGQENGCTITN